MNGLPDVAGGLFTATYRNVKLAGKAPPAANLSGTGSVSSPVLHHRAPLPALQAAQSRTQAAQQHHVTIMASHGG
jgi:hypothetical protein